MGWGRGVFVRIASAGVGDIILIGVKAERLLEEAAGRRPVPQVPQPTASEQRNFASLVQDIHKQTTEHRLTLSLTTEKRDLGIRRRLTQDCMGNPTVVQETVLESFATRTVLSQSGNLIVPPDSYFSVQSVTGVGDNNPQDYTLQVVGTKQGVAKLNYNAAFSVGPWVSNTGIPEFQSIVNNGNRGTDAIGEVDKALAGHNMMDKARALNYFVEDWLASISGGHMIPGTANNRFFRFSPPESTPQNPSLLQSFLPRRNSVQPPLFYAFPSLPVSVLRACNVSENVAPIVILYPAKAHSSSSSFLSV
ncbi:unnamed protein product [Amoebophrya sp. A120]|nr:unnamed protein product [Amoebophrya sp. A120]|eukprot:GSA120T00001232001.1